MTEQQLIIILCSCVGVLGFVLIALDHMNDKLRKENRELREQLRLKEAGKKDTYVS